MHKYELIAKLNNLKTNKSKYSDFADAIIKNYDNLDKININKIGELSFTSAPTVVRACKYLGVTGFKELINILLNDEESFVKVDNSKELTRIEMIQKCLLETKALLNNELLQKLAEDLVKNDKKVVLIGAGESYACLKIFARRMLRLGLNLNIYEDLQNAISHLNIFTQDSIVLALSVKGESQTILDIVNRSQSLGGKVYAITKYSPNSLNKICENLIHISHMPEYNEYLSRIDLESIFFIFDLLFEKIINLDKNRFIDNLSKTKVIL